MGVVISQSLGKTSRSGIAAGGKRGLTGLARFDDKEIIEKVVQICAEIFLRTSANPFSNTTKIWHCVPRAEGLPVHLVQVNFVSTGIVNSRDGVAHIVRCQGHLSIRRLHVLRSHEYVLRLGCQVL